MSVRAKFKVDSITESSFGKTIEMSPVYDPNPESENGKFYKATPGGKLSLSTVNEDAAKQFKVGDSFYLDFTKAE